MALTRRVAIERGIRGELRRVCVLSREPQYVGDDRREEHGSNEHIQDERGDQTAECAAGDDRGARKRAGGEESITNTADRDCAYRCQREQE